MKSLNYIIITSFLICFFSLNLFSQETESRYYSSKHEINIVADNIFAKNTGYYYTYNPYYPHYPNTYYPNIYVLEIGLGYKYHFSKSAIRSKISFGSNNYTTSNRSYSMYHKNEFNVFNTGFNLGYELHKNFNRGQIFYGADLSLKILQMEEKSTTLEDDNDPYFKEHYSKNKKDYSSFGISPLIGARFFFTPSLSVSTEIKFIIESFNGKTNTFYSLNMEENNSTHSGFRTTFGPLGSLSVNIHL